MIRKIEITHDAGIEMVSVENDAIDLEAYVEDRYPGASFVLVSEAVDAEQDGRPIQYMLSRFPADRMELIV